MDIIDLITSIHKAHKVITSCETCEHIENAEKYLEFFKEQTNNEVYYKRLYGKLNLKKEQINCNT